MEHKTRAVVSPPRIHRYTASGLGTPVACCQGCPRLAQGVPRVAITCVPMASSAAPLHAAKGTLAHPRRAWDNLDCPALHMGRSEVTGAVNVVVGRLTAGILCSSSLLRTLYTLDFSFKTTNEPTHGARVVDTIQHTTTAQEASSRGLLLQVRPCRSRKAQTYSSCRYSPRRTDGFCIWQ